MRVAAVDWSGRAVSALVMASGGGQLATLAEETDPIYRREGRIWAAGQ